MRDDLDELKQALMDRAELLVNEILGQRPNPHLSSYKQLRWGTKGSFAFEVSGPNTGLWFDHELGEGGDLLTLIQHRMCGGNFPQALHWARRWLGWPPSGPTVHAKQKSAPRAKDYGIKPSQINEAIASDESNRITSANQIWNSSRPVEMDSAGDRYLRITRGILPNGPWPKSIQYRSGFDPALVFRLTSPNGQISAVQIVRVNSDGKKRINHQSGLAKQTYGVIKGSTVRFEGSSDGPLLIAEGPETGLSVWAATGFETWVAAGQSNIKNMPFPKGRKLVFCNDDGPKNSPSRHQARTLLKKLGRKGYDVVEAMPWRVRRGDKSDFNDVIVQKGPSAVRERIEIAISPPATVSDPSVTLDRGSALLGDAVGQFFNDSASHFFTPYHAIQATVGLGKTEEVLHHSLSQLKKMRSDDDKRVIVIAVPQHRLSHEIAERFNELGKKHGLHAAVWRGREAMAPMSNTKMCSNLDEVHEAQTVLADITKEVCLSCPHYQGCAYLAQTDLVADVWIVAHQALFGKPPAPIEAEGVALLIVDESPWQAGLRGISGNGMSVALDALDDGEMPVPNGDKTLANQRAFLKMALCDEPDGPIKIERLYDSGLISSSAKVAYGLEWARKVTEGHWRKRQQNRTITPMAEIWSAIYELVDVIDRPVRSGRLSIERGNGRERIICVRTRKKLHDKWDVPTLLIDATLDIELVRPYWPNIKEVARIDVQTPHQRIYHAYDRAFGKSAFSGDITSGLIQSLRTTVLAIDRQTEGSLLVVSNKSTVDKLTLPDHIQVAWFNALAGRDQWRDVETIIIIGRAMPTPKLVEAMAGALTGKAIEEPVDWYENRDVEQTLRTADGMVMINSNADHHPDPLADAILQRISVGEVLQAIGRGRGIRREEDRPVTIFILNDVALPIAVDRFIDSDQFRWPSPIDRQLADGGIAFEDSRAASKVYPQLWATAEAAKKAIQRGRWGTFPYKELLTRKCPSPLEVTYQLAGAGRRPAVAFVDPRVVPEPQQKIEELLGPLVFYELANQQNEQDRKELFDSNKLMEGYRPSVIEDGWKSGQWFTWPSNDNEAFKLIYHFKDHSPAALKVNNSAFADLVTIYRHSLAA